MKKLLFLLLTFLGLSSFTLASLDIYLFYGEGCPHCTVQKGYFQELEQDYDFNIKEYEIYYNTDNSLLMQRFAGAYNANFNGVPVTIIGTDYFLGADKNQTEKLLKKHSSIGIYTDPYNIVLNYENKNTSEDFTQDGGNNQVDEDIIEEEDELEMIDKKVESGKIGQNCISPWGDAIENGKSILAYQSEFGFIDQPCLNEYRVCNDGELDGTYLYKNCEQQTITLQEYENFKEVPDMEIADYEETSFIENLNYKIILIVIGFVVLTIGLYLLLSKPKK